MNLGDHVRVSRAFLEAFKSTEDPRSTEADMSETDEQVVASQTRIARLRHDLKACVHIGHLQKRGSYSYRHIKIN